MTASYAAVASSGTEFDFFGHSGMLSSRPLEEILHTTVLAALQGTEPAAYRSTAEVSLEQQQKGSGFIAHPAVTDNCMQLGPMTGALEAANSDTSNTTRVVAGLAAFLSRHAISTIFTLTHSLLLHCCLVDNKSGILLS